MALKKGINVRHGMQFGEPGATSASELAYDANTTTKEKIDALATTVAGKQDALTFDSVPTDGSTNPVESNGVYDALATKQGKPTEITYADWQLLTPQQQETGNWLVTGVPGSSLSIRVTALEQNKQDKTDNTLATNSKQTTGAINELNSNLNTLESGLMGYYAAHVKSVTKELTVSNDANHVISFGISLPKIVVGATTGGNIICPNGTYADEWLGIVLGYDGTKVTSGTFNVTIYYLEP